MRGRNVILALLIIIVGLAITASKRGTFGRGAHTIRDMVDMVDAAAGSLIDGNWREVERFSRQEPAEGVKSIVVENRNGDVTIAGDTQDYVQVDAIRFGRGTDEEETTRNAQSAKLEVTRNGDAINVTVSGQQRFWMVARLNLTVSVPRGTRVDVKSASGDVEVRDITGSADVTTASGDVTIDRAGAATGNTASGDIKMTEVRGAEVNTASGDVKLQGIRGAVRGRLISGDAILEHVDGEVRLSAISGDISARAVDGSFSATTVSGSINLRDYTGADTNLKSTSGDVQVSLSTRLTGTFEAATVSGEITIAIPRDSDCEVDLASTSGDIETDLQMRNVSQSRRHLSGVVGAGRGRLKLRSVSGSLDVNETPAQAPPAAAVKGNETPARTPLPPRSGETGSEEWGPVVR
jgi:DUF4097 and DUF4098 domain-containing protein YvlB